MIVTKNRQKKSETEIQDLINNSLLNNKRFKRKSKRK